MVIQLIQHLYKALIKFITPPFCRNCRLFLENDEVFCFSCMQLIHPIAPIDLIVTDSITCPIWAISCYQEPLRSLVLAKMYSDRVAAIQLAQLMLALTPLKEHSFDVVVPVPLHWRRYAHRGYNQAHEMAHIIAKNKNIPCVNMLRRIKSTTYQASLASTERWYNVKNAFSLRVPNNKQYYGKHILLVDDLFTTGATLKAATKELYRLKPASVTIVVACRVA